MASRINPNGEEKTVSNLAPSNIKSHPFIKVIHFYKSEKEERIDYTMRMYVGTTDFCPIVARGNIFEGIEAEV